MQRTDSDCLRFVAKFTLTLETLVYGFETIEDRSARTPYACAFHSLMLRIGYNQIPRNWKVYFTKTNINDGQGTTSSIVCFSERPALPLLRSSLRQPISQWRNGSHIAVYEADRSSWNIDMHWVSPLQDPLPPTTSGQVKLHSQDLIPCRFFSSTAWQAGFIVFRKCE